MSVRHYVRDVSPYFQEFLVELMRSAYRARVRGDADTYEAALAHLYDSLPAHVRAEVLRELQQRLGVDVGDLSDVLD